MYLNKSQINMNMVKLYRSVFHRVLLSIGFNIQAS